MTTQGKKAGWGKAPERQKQGHCARSFSWEGQSHKRKKVTLKKPKLLLRIAEHRAVREFCEVGRQIWRSDCIKIREGGRVGNTDLEDLGPKPSDLSP